MFEVGITHAPVRRLATPYRKSFPAAGGSACGPKGLSKGLLKGPPLTVRGSPKKGRAASRTQGYWTGSFHDVVRSYARARCA